jgi:hypothetical protein
MNDSEPPARIPGLNDTGEALNQEFLSRKDLLRSLVLQIRKDFDSAGIPIHLLLNKKYSFEELNKLVSDAFMQAGATAMFNLLYRVDVSEKQLHQGMPTPGIDPDLVAALVIKRELQKVVLRKLYS